MRPSHGPAAVLIAVASVALAACGGGSGGPGVASLSGSNGATAGRTATTVPHGKPSQLLAEFASCMRQNGYPNMTDPYTDSNGTIHVSIPDAGNGNTGPFSFKDSTCSQYLTAASTALRGGQPIQKPDYSKLLAFSRCMRAHGITDFPDPQAGGGLRIQSTQGSDLNPNSASFSAASKTCGKSAGMPQFGTAQRGGIQVTQGGGPGPGQAGTQGGGFATQAG